MTFHTIGGLDPAAPGVRRALEDEIERLIAMLDAIDPDPDLEPSLGSGSDLHGSTNQQHWCDGATDNREFEDEREPEDEHGGDINDEPHDEETDDDDKEPELGWENPMAEESTRDEGGLIYSRDGDSMGCDFLR